MNGFQGNQQPSLKKMNNIIYKITNLVNDKVYIGQTVKVLNCRKAEHVHRCNFGERQHKLYKSMRKHGIDNFKFEVIFCCFKRKYLDEMEKYFIRKYDSFVHGYNATDGGDSISDETRANLRKALKGRKIHGSMLKLWITEGKVVLVKNQNGTKSNFPMALSK